MFLQEEAILCAAATQPARAEHMRHTLFTEEAAAKTSVTELLAAADRRSVQDQRAQVEDLQRRLSAAQAGLVDADDNAARSTGLHQKVEELFMKSSGGRTGPPQQLGLPGLDAAARRSATHRCPRLPRTRADTGRLPVQACMAMMLRLPPGCRYRWLRQRGPAHIHRRQAAEVSVVG